jgi:hypothetical protein
VKFQGGLGGTREALGGDGDENHNESRVKMEFVERKSKEPSGQVTIKYNYQDFLSREHNLTDQCKALVESLS